MIIPELNAVAIEARFQCPECGKEQVGILLSPIEERSLRNLEQAMRALSEAPEAPLCCEQETELKNMSYRFDEPGVDELEYDPDQKIITLRGEEIESEEQLLEKTGRPYSPADLHRIKLQQLPSAPYSPSPGIVTLKFTREHPELIEEQVRKAEAILQEEDGEEVIGPINWRELPGHHTWLGAESEKIMNEDETVVSVIATPKLLQAIEESGDETELQIRKQGHRLQISSGEISLNYRVRAVIDLTVEKPLTLKEAAKWVTLAHARGLQCMTETIELLRASGAEIGIGEPGMIQVSPPGQGDIKAEINLESICRKSEYQPRVATRQIQSMLGAIQQGSKGRRRLGIKKPCGCTPILTITLRPESWGKELRETEEGIDTVGRQSFAGIDKVLVEDCPHSLAYITRSQAEASGRSEEDLFEEAEANLKKQCLSCRPNPSAPWKRRYTRLPSWGTTPQA